MSDTNANNSTPAEKPLPSSVPPGYRGNTPLMLQYFATCEENPGVILLIRVGGFFEAYSISFELRGERQVEYVAANATCPV